MSESLMESLEMERKVRDNYVIQAVEELTLAQDQASDNEARTLAELSKMSSEALTINTESAPTVISSAYIDPRHEIVKLKDYTTFRYEEVNDTVTIAELYQRDNVEVNIDELVNTKASEAIVETVDDKKYLVTNDRIAELELDENGDLRNLVVPEETTIPSLTIGEEWHIDSNHITAPVKRVIAKVDEVSTKDTEQLDKYSALIKYGAWQEPFVEAHDLLEAAASDSASLPANQNTADQAISADIDRGSRISRIRKLPLLACIKLHGAILQSTNKLQELKSKDNKNKAARVLAAGGLLGAAAVALYLLENKGGAHGMTHSLASHATKTPSSAPYSNLESLLPKASNANHLGHTLVLDPVHHTAKHIHEAAKHTHAAAHKVSDSHRVAETAKANEFTLTPEHSSTWSTMANIVSSHNPELSAQQAQTVVANHIQQVLSYNHLTTAMAHNLPTNYHFRIPHHILEKLLKGED